MTTTNSESGKFYLGLCMAGAVSAGAYTAGVMDYLLEALEEWEKRRGGEGVPTHRVEIPVMGGASAGGMTSIITGAALQQGITHIDVPIPGNLLAEHPENILYHSWVDLTNEDMFSVMMGTGDIKPGEVVSALNSDFIDNVAQRVISPNPPISSGVKLQDFFPPRLKIFTTLSNLGGYLYDVSFNAQTQNAHLPYYMEVHNDYACFELYDDAATTPTPGWIPLNIPNQVNAPIAINAAMATGAFPVGLKSRLLTRNVADVNLDPLMDPNTLSAIQMDGAGTYTSLNIDGGMINNEPFDKVRDVLIQISKQDDPKVYEDFNQFNATVLMIAPFPSSKPTPISTSQNLLNVIGLTLSAMISQMRSKPAHLVSAMDPNCAGQYLIAPSRNVPSPGDNSGEMGQPIQGEKAIACGALSGFGGFLNKEFRVHDYFLGRYNCKIFLRDYFTIPEAALQNNPIFRDGYANADVSKHKTANGAYQIIPVFDDVNYDFPSFVFNSGSNWPAVASSDVTKFTGAIKQRIQAVLLNVANFGGVTKFFLRLGTWVILNNLLANSIINTIEKALTDWKLLKQE